MLRLASGGDASGAKRFDAAGDVAAAILRSLLPSASHCTQLRADLI